MAAPSLNTIAGRLVDARATELELWEDWAQPTEVFCEALLQNATEQKRWKGPRGASSLVVLADGWNVGPRKDDWVVREKLLALSTAGHAVAPAEKWGLLAPVAAADDSDSAEGQWKRWGRTLPWSELVSALRPRRRSPLQVSNPRPSPPLFLGARTAPLLDGHASEGGGSDREGTARHAVPDHAFANDGGAGPRELLRSARSAAWRGPSG